MRKPVFYPVLAAGLGLLAAGLRMWQRTAGYDSGGLPVRFALPSVILTVFLLLCAGAFLFLALKQPKTLEDQSAALPQGGTAAVMFAAAGVLVLAGGMWNLMAFARSYHASFGVMYASPADQWQATRAFLASNLLPGVVAVASVPTAVALLARAKQLKAGEGTPSPFAAMMPPVFGWLWLIRIFRKHASNPIVWDYALLLLAVVALLISTYERAGFAFGVGKPRRTMFTTPLALVLAVAALPDSGGIANAVTLIGLGLHTAVELSALAGSLEYTPKRLAADPSNETIQQEDTPHESK